MPKQGEDYRSRVLREQPASDWRYWWALQDFANPGLASTPPDEMYGGLKQLMNRTGNADVNSEPLICFVHIPKTGGTSITRFCERLAPPPETLQISHAGSPWFIPPGLILRARIALGHGVRLIPSLYPWRRCRITTLVRDPLQRAVSEYRYLRRASIPHEALSVRAKVAKTLDLNEYLLAYSRAAPNFMVGHLRARPIVPMPVADGWKREELPVPPGLRTRKLGGIEILEPDLLATTENIDALGRMLARAIGVEPRGLVGHHNRSPEAAPSLSEEVQQVFSEANALDYQLYELAKNTTQSVI